MDPEQAMQQVDVVGHAQLSLTVHGEVVPAGYLLRLRREQRLDLPLDTARRHQASDSIGQPSNGTATPRGTTITGHVESSIR